ncbi:hypothetical protein [Duganella violaceipulchra]|uniref:DNA-binding beta-propeller fold protein YncE n=1 Tax=Duganella violaceipulchra TaxID=2849652 RepID=A0AA41L5U2_9BURK|nr:hypothetical protein [Duganella violaceicalia]MBV6324579.1 hypothetical protein [Duganella violaceicalia]MCP2009286.1 DNA-binding beta-propeller fold protein YncE [Duganella violaceicalia]
MPEHRDDVANTPVNVNQPFAAGAGQHDRAAFVGVFDIGQGGFNGVFNADGRPFLYYDMGGGIGGLLFTYPSPAPVFCNSSLRMIVQSHFDEDHYKTSTLPAFRALLGAGHRIVIPRQPMGIFGGAALANLLANGVHIHYWTVAGLASIQLGNTGVEIIKCRGSGKNHAGLALRIRDPGAPAEWMLLPADSHYRHQVFPWDLGGALVDGNVIGISPTHHGARERAANIPLALVPGVRVSAYSLGAGNLFGHPFHDAQAAAGDGVHAYATQGYAAEGRMQTTGRPINQANAGPRGSNLGMLLHGADPARQGRDPYHSGVLGPVPGVAIALIAAASAAAHRVAGGAPYGNHLAVAAAYQAALEHHTLGDAHRPVADYIAERGAPGAPAAPIVAAAGGAMRPWLAAGINGNVSADAAEAAAAAEPVARAVAQLVAAAAISAAVEATDLAITAHAAQAAAGAGAKRQMQEARRAVRGAVANNSTPRTLGAGAAAAVTKAVDGLRCFQPMGLAYDAAAGLLLLADTGSGVIASLDYASGALVRRAGAPGREGHADGNGIAASFRRPHGLALCNNGLYIADSGNHTIRKLSQHGDVETLAGAAQTPGADDGVGAGARFRHPQGLAYDTVRDLLYVADTGNHTIRVMEYKAMPDAYDCLTLAGAATTAGTADGAGTTARFDTPAGLALDAVGMLYVADQGNHTIRKVAPRNNCVTLAGRDQQPGTQDGLGAAARFTAPSAIAADGAGGFYIADGHCIRHLSAAGVVRTIAGDAVTPGALDGPGPQARFRQPGGLVYDVGAHVLWVADTDNHAVRHINLVPDPAMVLTACGTWGVTGSADGLGAAALFNQPCALQRRGTDLLVADRGNHTIRSMDAAGNVSTIAGLALQHGGDNGPFGAGRLNAPRGLALANGRVWIADQNGTGLRSLDQHNVLASHPCQAIGSVRGLAAHNNLLYVMDAVHHLVHEVDTGHVALNRRQFGQADQDGGIDGNLADAELAVALAAAQGAHATLAGAMLRAPLAAAADASGNLALVSPDSACVRMLTLETAWVCTVAGEAGQTGAIDGPAGAARFNGPTAVTAGDAGAIIVADTGNNVIRQLAANGAVSTLAGAAGEQGDTDGAAPATARFRAPSALAFNNHMLYVADRRSHKLRRLAANQVDSMRPVNVAKALVAYALARGVAGPPAAYPQQAAIDLLAAELCARAAQAYCMTMAAGFGGPASDAAGVLVAARLPPEAAGDAHGQLAALANVEPGVLAAIAAAAALGPAVETQTTGVVLPAAPTAAQVAAFESRLVIAAVAALVAVREGPGAGNAVLACAAVAAARAASAAARGAPLIGCHRHPSSCGANLCSLMIHEFG